MKKLINLVAVSVGSGMLLGAGLRSLDNRAQQRNKSGNSDQSQDSNHDLLARINGIQQKLDRLSTPFSGNEAVSALALQLRLDAQQAEAEKLRSTVHTALTAIHQTKETTERMAVELRDWVAEDIGKRVAEAEVRLEQSLSHVRQETLEALADKVQSKVVERISRLEDEVAGQSAAMIELRDCSLKTEQSMQRLLEGIDRLVSAQSQITHN